MPARRGDRVAPPARPDGWEARFATSEAAKGWEELCRVARANTWEAWVVLTERPTRPENPTRQHRLRGDFADRQVGGRTLEQWQYEVTAAGRIWYCPDRERPHRLGRRCEPRTSEGDRVDRRRLLLGVVVGVVVLALVMTVVVVMLTSALSGDTVRQSNAFATMDRLIYAVHRWLRPDRDIDPPPPSRIARASGGQRTTTRREGGSLPD